MDQPPNQLLVIRTPADPPAPTGAADSVTGHGMQGPMLAAAAPSFLSVTAVTFVPGARTNWHTHKDRQVLVVETGLGVVQIKGGPARLLRPGDVALVPPDVVHWHGATTASLFRHTSILHGGPSATTWLEPVDEGEYQGVATPGAQG